MRYFKPTIFIPQILDSLSIRLFFIVLISLINVFKNFAQKQVCRLDDVPEGWCVMDVRYNQNKCQPLGENGYIYDIVSTDGQNSMLVCLISPIPKGWRLNTKLKCPGKCCLNEYRNLIERINPINITGGGGTTVKPPKIPKIIYTPTYNVMFTGNNGFFYCFGNENYLDWNQYIGKNGETLWKKNRNININLPSENNCPKKGCRFYLGGKNGEIFTIDQQGVMKWYKYEGLNGEQTWNKFGGIEISSGWNAYSNVIIGGDNNIFAIDKLGRMKWYKYDGYGDKIIWTQAGEKDLGSGWESYYTVFADKGNQIYGVTKKESFGGKKGIVIGGADGDLYLYKFITENGSFEPRVNLNSNGWNSYYEILGGEKGEIYGITKNGTINYYHLINNGIWGKGTKNRIDHDLFSTTHTIYVDPN